MNCSRCGADNPPKDKYCGQCGNALEEPSRLQRTLESLGWLVMASGLIILALTAVYYLIMTVGGIWGIGEGLYAALFPISYPVSGQGWQWPGLTVGVLLGILGIMISVRARGQLPRVSGKVAKSLFLVGGVIVLSGAAFGAFPRFFYGLIYESGVSIQSVRGMYSIAYQALVLTGLALILAGMVWASWKDRRWRIPSASAAAMHDAADEERSPH